MRWRSERVEAAPLSFAVLDCDVDGSLMSEVSPLPVADIVRGFCESRAGLVETMEGPRLVFGEELLSLAAAVG